METRGCAKTCRRLVIGLLAIGLAPLSQGGELQLLWPDAEPKLPAALSEPAPEAFEIRRGNVTVPADLKETCERAAPGDVLRFSFFDAPSSPSAALPDQTVTVVAVERSPLNLVVLRGRLKGCPWESFALTVAEDGFVISCEDLDKHMLFRAFGDPRTGLGQVIEVDSALIPPRKCGTEYRSACPEQGHE